ncbi:hypothetical protein KIPB_005267 [Kipferlia bialata]|uniref:UmuC domain-containing protein n=1 Tax=Kipferlia bialata TaxID=797122 RepID=A0A9K3CWR8_9EUKA|nr:hypothetical protein KIPB_005267 [Kipferlia bialata]|eukprot:g5267.t1
MQLAPNKKRLFHALPCVTPDWIVQSAIQGVRLNPRDFSIKAGDRAQLGRHTYNQARPDQPDGASPTVPDTSGDTDKGSGSGGDSDNTTGDARSETRRVIEARADAEAWNTTEEGGSVEDHPTTDIGTTVSGEEGVDTQPAEPVTMVYTIPLAVLARSKKVNRRRNRLLRGCAAITRHQDRQCISETRTKYGMVVGEPTDEISEYAASLRSVEAAKNLLDGVDLGETEGVADTSGTKSVPEGGQKKEGEAGSLGLDGQGFSVQDFYKKSRLSKLGAYKQDAIDFLSTQTARGPVPSLPPGARDRIYFHADLDCFFVQASILALPPEERGAYLNRPVFVSHSTSAGSADVSSCNYPARASGVKNGMWLKQALELCPTAVVVPYAYDTYKAVSRRFYRVLAALSSAVEPVSCDEAYIDVTGLYRHYFGGDQTPGETDPSATSDTVPDADQAMALAKRLRETVERVTGIQCSVGAGPSLLCARVATKQAKPNGAAYLSKRETAQCLAGQPPSALPGVGPSITRRLDEAGIKTCGQLARMDLTQAKAILGPKQGVTLMENANGHSDRVFSAVGVNRPKKAPKQVSVHLNWGVRVTSMQEASEYVASLSRELDTRMAGLTGKRLTLTLNMRAPGEDVNCAKHLGCGRTVAYPVACAVDKAKTTSQMGQDLLNEIYPQLGNVEFGICDLRGLEMRYANVRLRTDPKAAKARAEKRRAMHEKMAAKSLRAKANPDNSLKGVSSDFLADLPKALRQEVLCNVELHLSADRHIGTLGEHAPPPTSPPTEMSPSPPPPKRGAKDGAEGVDVFPSVAKTSEDETTRAIQRRLAEVALMPMSIRPTLKRALLARALQDGHMSAVYTLALDPDVGAAAASALLARWG